MLQRRSDSALLECVWQTVRRIESHLKGINTWETCPEGRKRIFSKIEKIIWLRSISLFIHWWQNTPEYWKKNFCQLSKNKDVFMSGVKQIAFSEFIYFNFILDPFMLYTIHDNRKKIEHHQFLLHDACKMQRL